MTIIKSNSEGFFADYAGNQLVVYKVGDANDFPVAKIRQNVNGWQGLAIVGIQGNSGNRFDKLSAIEKADIATIVTKVVKGEIYEQQDE